VTRGRLSQRAGSLGLNGGGAAAAVPPEQGKTPCLDNSRQAWFPVVRLTSSFHTLVKGINLEYISLGNCPALRATQEDR